jgi:hypothetical protein
MTEPVHILHPSLWESLAQADPKDICQRSRAQFDKATGAFLLDFLQERYRIKPDSREIKPDTDTISEGDPSIDLQVILLTYLLNVREISLADRLVAVGSLKGGKCFFQGPHSFPLDPLIEQYGHDSEAFLDRGLSLGATQENYGDVSVRFPALPRVPVVMVLWVADEEFTPRLSVVFDATVDQHLPLDAIYGLVTEICRRMTT